MESQKVIELSHEIANELEREAWFELEKARIYHEGYMKACEDFDKKLRQAISVEEIEV